MSVQSIPDCNHVKSVSSLSALRQPSSPPGYRPIHSPRVALLPSGSPRHAHVRLLDPESTKLETELSPVDFARICAACEVLAGNRTSNPTELSAPAPSMLGTEAQVALQSQSKDCPKVHLRLSRTRTTGIGWTRGERRGQLPKSPGPT